jgi:hypothetical protein
LTGCPGYSNSGTVRGRCHGTEPSGGLNLIADAPAENNAATTIYFVCESF